MGSTNSSGAPSFLREAAKSAIEGALLAALFAAGIVWFLDGAQARLALIGIGAAWFATTLSTAILLKHRTDDLQGFVRAFGGGAALRAGVLIALMAGVWGRGWQTQAPLLAAYALGVLFLSLVEYRQVTRKD